MAGKKVAIRGWKQTQPEQWIPEDIPPTLPVPGRARKDNPSSDPKAPLMFPKVPKPPISKTEPKPKAEKPTYTATRHRPTEVQPKHMDAVTHPEYYRWDAEPSKRDNRKVESPVANANTPLTQKKVDNLAKGTEKKAPTIKPRSGLGGMTAEQKKKDYIRNENKAEEAGKRKAAQDKAPKKHEQGAKGKRGGR